MVRPNHEHGCFRIDMCMGTCTDICIYMYIAMCIVICIGMHIATSVASVHVCMHIGYLAFCFSALAPTSAIPITVDFRVRDKTYKHISVCSLDGPTRMHILCNICTHT